MFRLCAGIAGKDEDVEALYQDPDLIVILFGAIATATSILTGWTLYRSSTAEYRSKGIAIAQGIAELERGNSFEP